METVSQKSAGVFSLFSFKKTKQYYYSHESSNSNNQNQSHDAINSKSKNSKNDRKNILQFVGGQCRERILPAVPIQYPIL